MCDCVRIERVLGVFIAKDEENESVMSSDSQIYKGIAFNTLA